MTFGLRIIGVVTGVISALVAGLFMLMGPWVTDPPLPNFSLIASYCYPMLLLFAGSALVRSAPTGFWLAVLGLGCAFLTVMPYVTNVSLPRAETIVVGVLVCLPGMTVGVVALFCMRHIARQHRPLMRR